MFQPAERSVILWYLYLTLPSFLAELLASHAPSSASDALASSAVITLLLPTLDSATFSAANVAYSAFFGASPPARACVGTGECVTLHCVAWAPERASEHLNGIKGECSEKGVRKSLHVQSLSYWAPANIGPYSQAINVHLHFCMRSSYDGVPADPTMDICIGPNRSPPSFSVTPSILSYPTTVSPRC